MATSGFEMSCPNSDMLIIPLLRAIMKKVAAGSW
jgi:hypothetical protein